MIATNSCIAWSDEVKFVARSGSQLAMFKIGDATIWTEDANPETSLLTVPIDGYEPYANCSLVAHKHQGNDLVVGLEFVLDKSKPQTRLIFNEASFYNRMQLKNWNGKLLLIRQFKQAADGKWKIGASLYAGSLWSSAIDEELKSFEITPNGEFHAVFKRKWKLVPPETWNNEKKIEAPGGETKFRFKYDAANQLLLTANEGGEFRYVNDSGLLIRY